MSSAYMIQTRYLNPASIRDNYVSQRKHPYVVEAVLYPLARKSICRLEFFICSD